MSTSIERELAELETRVDLLSRSELFTGVSQDKLRMLAENANVRSYDAGAVICESGTVASSIFILRFGVCRLDSVPGSDAIEGFGRTFGDSALFDQDSVRTATIKALGQVIALEVPYSAIMEHVWDEIMPIVGQRLVRLVRMINIRHRELWEELAAIRLPRNGHARPDTEDT